MIVYDSKAEPPAIAPVIYARVLIENQHPLRQPGSWTWKVFLSTCDSPFNAQCHVESQWDYKWPYTAEVAARRWCKRLGLAVIDITSEGP